MYFLVVFSPSLRWWYFLFILWLACLLFWHIWFCCCDVYQKLFSWHVLLSVSVYILYSRRYIYTYIHMCIYVYIYVIYEMSGFDLVVLEFRVHVDFRNNCSCVHQKFSNRQFPDQNLKTTHFPVKIIYYFFYLFFSRFIYCKPFTEKKLIKLSFLFTLIIIWDRFVVNLFVCNIIFYLIVQLF